MFITRLISGIVLVAIALLVNHVGGPLLLLTMLAISLIGMFELFRAVKIREKGTNSLTTAAYAGAVLWYVAVWLGHVYGERFDHFYVSFLAAGLIILLFVYVRVCGCLPELHLSDEGASGRKMACMADPAVLLGM